MEVGTVVPFAGASAPSGYLLCDGASYLRSSYSALFAVIGTSFGAADGTHFNVPDLRGRVPVGAGEGVGALVDDVGTGVPDGDPIEPALALGEWTGHVAHYQAGNEVGAHTHGINDPTHYHGAQSAPHHHSMDIKYATDTSVGGSSKRLNDAEGVTGASGNSAVPVGNDTEAVITVNAQYTGVSVIANSLGHGMDIHNPMLAMNYIIKV